MYTKPHCKQYKMLMNHKDTEIIKTGMNFLFIEGVESNTKWD